MRTRTHWYGTLFLTLAILAAWLFWRQVPAIGRSPAPGPAVVHLAPQPQGVFGVDEPITLTLPWPANPRQVYRAVRVRPAVAWHLTRTSQDVYQIHPTAYWPGGARIAVRVQVARLFPGRPVAPAVTDTVRTDDSRTVVVNLTLQVLQAYEGNRLVATLPISSGVTPEYPTPTGHFYIWRRVRVGDMSDGRPGEPGAYHVAHVPYAQYVYRGVAIHGAYWARQFGVPHSHGCIQLSTRTGNLHPAGVPEDAGWLWDFAHLGTPVIIEGTTPPHTRLLRYPRPPRGLSARDATVRPAPGPRPPAPGR